MIYDFFAVFDVHIAVNMYRGLNQFSDLLVI